MFSGHWKESNEDVIRMEIVDPNINLDSLRIVLGSLYQDELTVEPAEVIPLLATATLLQLDGVEVLLSFNIAIKDLAIMYCPYFI